MSWSGADAQWMTQALALARRGWYSTAPNPRVGAVIVAQDGRLIGEGFHLRAGEPHAEVFALRQAGEAARGATLYVSLEPCSHQGRTPPCADAVIRAGIRRVVIGCQDPNPLVAGQGIARLQAAGIEVSCGVLETEARALNPGFESRMRRNRPWLCLKYGASIDGRTALANGLSQWITGVDARRDVQRKRAESSALLTGIGTVLADDPRLSVRADELPELAQGPIRQPWRVVVDSRGQLPAAARLFDGASRVIQVCATERQGLSSAETWCLPNAQGKVDLPALLTRLAAEGCNDLWVEAGPELGGALITAGLVDELWLYLAPMLLGSAAKPLMNLPDLSDLALASRWRYADVRHLGSDLRVVLTPDS